MFDSVLIANRGEIAVRVTATLRRLGIRSIAVYSDADAGARHVREADSAVRIGPAPARESYLDIERVLEAAIGAGAQAIHPGYGFLAENAAFARACAAAGVVLIGPPPEAMEVMGDKIRAKRAVGAAGVPVVPGRADEGMDDAALRTAAEEVGFPVLVKPSAGGGGKGMHVASDLAELTAVLPRARREAASSFGDDTLFVERFVATPRHIEVQVLADTRGTTIHLGERECSLQRRHQKVIEEAPSSLLDAATRERIGASACATARSVSYTGAGTVEFIVGADRPDEYFFMEMNTRLQVEHPVTELVTGVDLVEEQVRVAAGEPLRLAQADLRLRGHAVEARLYAEDPEQEFLPTGGRALVVREPRGPGIRVDSGITEGSEVGVTYDPMIAKVIAWGDDRDAALARLQRALSETAVLGVGTNAAFLRRLVSHPDVRAGRLDTDLIAREIGELTGHEPPDIAWAAAALVRLAANQPPGPVIDPWSIPDGWRVGAHHTTTHLLRLPGREAVPVMVSGDPGGATVTVDGEPVRPASITIDGPTASVTLGAGSWPVGWAIDGSTTWVHVVGATWGFAELPPERRGLRGEVADTDVRSPMPGKVIAVLDSDTITGGLADAGTALVTIEAMKMEHALVAPVTGTVELLVGVGDQVDRDQVVARMQPMSGDDGIASGLGHSTQ
jgi:acetyl-CoA/propionyl-CoA carboxylase biotin carboxyl carrier protein